MAPGAAPTTRSVGADPTRAGRPAICGVPPIGHLQPVVAVVDEALLAYPRIWAAAGHPHAVFALTPEELVRMTGGRVAKVG
jgi:prolyl-tRNA editing enzyme YbaK/EbsC (Cys-tRNA(Pro) deacylase)